MPMPMPMPMVFMMFTEVDDGGVVMSAEDGDEGFCDVYRGR